MASPAVIAPQVNGVAPLSRPDSPASSINSSTKRKRESSDDDAADPNRAEPTKPSANGLHSSQHCKSLVRDFFDVLQSSSLFKRPLTDTVSDGEPSPKRAKSEDGKLITIAEKVTDGTYETLDDFVADVVQVANAQVNELETATPSDANTLAKTIALRTKALELYRQELAYPNAPPTFSGKPAPNQPQTQNTGNLALTAIGTAPTARPLFTSLQRNPAKSFAGAPLPRGLTVTRILSDLPASGEKSGRTPTLGELFPSPRNLPPLQPPKAPKTATKSNVLTFYHPELAEKSKYRSGTYFSSTISTGHWLDYSNATPTAHAKTKRRERAQSLAGIKPSTTELEMSEMEALFRGAFSTFAPCRDDSGAIVPSGQVSRIWWQRVGRRNFSRIVEAEEPAEGPEAVPATDETLEVEIDEDTVKAAIDNWDETAIDPSLDYALGKKSDHEKEVDDLLEEVSDLIETLASYQRNRNLTLPTSQDRYSADPVNGDMLRNGHLSHQPSEEEASTYDALKAQLALIIQTLPPYAVARLNSDKLEELAVSTRIEIRSDEYRGVMEEDEPARLARFAAQAATSNQQRQAQRAPSVSGQYANHQYQQQFTPSARPVGNAPHFPQTPVRQAQNMYPRGPSSVPIPQPHQQVQPRPAPGTQFRPMYAPQLAKAQGPYGHANMQPQFAGTPTQPRMQQHQHPNYNMAQGNAPNHRFAPGFPGGGFPPHQQIQPHPQHGQPSPHPQQSPHPPPMPHPQQPPYSPYTNGGPMPRTISPQIPQNHQYSQSPTPPQQHQQISRPPPPYGSPGPGIPPNAVPRQYQTGSPGPGMMQGEGGPPGPGGNRTPSNLTGFATVMPEGQQRQLMEQARARADAEQRASGHMGKVTQGEVVGLAGIGLAGHMDVHKVAAAKMQQQQQQQQQQHHQQMGNNHVVNNNSVSPSPNVAPVQPGGGGGMVVNGATPGSASPAPPQ
ncbi:uncharacterized protein C8A04DRAFT_37753 [Dichotomopilus funicola]|uniref:Uncharacterized protein n=1 Tax=Dichotomopilus funicola TaxID=1934379 RepID=A0AAN6V1B7_9PEZI|nr:hypothetical protein C8A04DRAFT_37753 [Dichotomopilus funicola]